MATKAEILAAAEELFGIVPRTQAIDVARFMLEAAERVRMSQMRDIFGDSVDIAAE
jgi:hypothetical protein